MNYGNWIIAIGIINIFTIFSGLPTGTKKLVFVVTTLALILIGMIVRAIAKRKKQKVSLARIEPEPEELSEPVYDNTSE